MEDKQFKLELKTHKKIFGTLHGILQEGQLAKTPLGFNFDLMCKHVKATTPNRKILYAGLESLGFKVQPSYISPGLYKTNAPIKAVYDIIKAWKLKNMGQQKYLSNAKQQFSLNILQQENQYKPDFQFEAQKHKKVPKFISMGPNMGPKGKPESRVLTENEVTQLSKIKSQEKNVKNQKNEQKQEQTIKETQLSQKKEKRKRSQTKKQ